MAAKSAAVIVFAISAANAGFRITNESRFDASSVSGPARSDSLETGRGTLTSLLDLSYDDDSGEIDYYFNFSGRATNNRNTDYRDFSVSRINARLIMDRHRVSLGDIMQPLSRYSMGASLKGFSYSTGFEGTLSPEIDIIYGFQSPRWDSLFSSGNKLKSVQRQAYGLKISAYPLEAWRFSVHYAGSDDSQRVYENDILYRGAVYGLEWGFDPFAGLSLSGETSFSDINLDYKGTSSDQKSGFANRITFRGYGDDLRLDLDYERVAADFYTVLGSASPDRERFRGRWVQDFSNQTSVSYSGLWFRDNLDGKKSDTTHNYRPEIRFTLRNLFGRRFASGDASISPEYRRGGVREDNFFIDFGYGDRFGLYDSNSRLGIAYFKTHGGIRDTVEYVANTSLSTRRSIRNLILRPNMRLGTRISDNNNLDTLDLINEASLGTGVDSPDTGISSGLQLGLNKNIRDEHNDSFRFFLSFHLNYQPLFADNYSFYARYGFNDFRSDDSDRNYRENSFSTGMSFRHW